MQFENIAGLVEMAFVYAVALVFGIWQLVSVRRDLKRSQEARERARPDSNEDA